MNTIEKSGIIFDEFYLVDSKEELQEKMKDCEKDLESHIEKQSIWNEQALRQKEKMFADLKSIFEMHLNGTV